MVLIIGIFGIIGICAENTGIDTMIDTFNTAVTQTASEILGKHRQPKKPWVTTDILKLCDKRRELKNKKSEVEGAKQYREINQFIKKSMRKARET